MKELHFIKGMVMLSVLTFNLSAFTSCSDDEDFAPQHNALPEDGVIRVSASVNQLVASRANNEVIPYAGEDLGLYIRPSNAGNWGYDATTNKYTYPNVKFTKTGEEWSHDRNTPMLWKGSGVNYEYYAYAPYCTKDDNTDGKIPFDLTTTNQTDLLWASETGTASTLLNGQKELNIEFEHAFCKVAVEISLADEFYQNEVKTNPITSISISSSSIKGNLDVFKGNVYVNSENAQDENNPTAGNLSFTISDSEHTPGGRLTDGTYKSSEIFYAPGNENFKVQITTNPGGRIYTYTHGSEYTFERGKRYIIKLKMGKDVVQMDGITATMWQDAGNAGNLETE